MERIANHQSVQMKDRLMTRDISLFFWASSKGGDISACIKRFLYTKKEGHPSDNLLICGGETGI